MIRGEVCWIACVCLWLANPDLCASKPTAVYVQTFQACSLDKPCALVAITAVFLMGPRGTDRFRSLTHSECGIPQGSSPLALVGDYQNENCGTWVPGQNYFDCVVGLYGYGRVGLARVTGRQNDLVVQEHLIALDLIPAMAAPVGHH